MDLDLAARCTFWGVSIGLTVSWIALLGVNQGCIQKFLAVPTISDARIVLCIFLIGMMLTKSISCFTGLIMYAHYEGCDPLSTGDVKRVDQLLPHYVMQVANTIPGLAGLFVAGVFSTALSTMSAALNTMAGTLYEDFISRCLSPNGQRHAGIIMKVSVIVFGAVCVALVMLVERLGNILPLSITLSSITTGPLLGLFTLGILYPWANSRGALAGSITSVLIVMWTVCGSQYYKASGHLKYPHLPLSTAECGGNVSTITSAMLNATQATHVTQDDGIFFLYKLSYMYYTVLGTMIVLIVGVLVSWMTGGQDLTTLNPDLITPALHHLLPKRKLMQQMKEYTIVQQSLEVKE